MSRRETPQFWLRPAAAASEPRLLRDTQDSCDKNAVDLGFVFMFCIVFLFLLFLSLFNSRWNGKCQLKLCRIPQISSHSASYIFLFLIVYFLQHVRCTLSSSSKPPNHHLALLQLFWQSWIPPCSKPRNYLYISWKVPTNARCYNMKLIYYNHNINSPICFDPLRVIFREKNINM